MNNTTENLIQALTEYIPPANVEVTYRLIYNSDTGEPISVTTEFTDKPYIEISQEEASAQPQLDPRVRVENGQLIRHIKKLTAVEEPNRLTVISKDTGNISTDEYSMLIINNNGKNRWTYE